MKKDLLFEVGLKAVIRNKDGDFLLLKRSNPYISDIDNGDTKKLRWDLPGGRVESGENIQNALKREVKEETNLDVTKTIRILDVHESFYHKGFHTVRIYFEVITKGTVKVSEEHCEAQWYNREEIIKLSKQDVVERSTAKLFAEIAPPFAEA